MNKIIFYKDIFEELVHKHGVFKTISIINSIRHFSTPLKQAFFNFFYQSPQSDIDFSANGVSINELIEEEHFEPVLAFIMLDWIEKHPIDAFDYMERYRFRTPVQELNDDEKLMIRNRLAEICKARNISNPKSADEDTSDILVNDNSPC